MVQEGHSRWPVYRGNRDNIIGMILVKSLILIDPKDCVKVRDLNLRRLPIVGETMPLYKVLDMFQQGKSHMAVIIDSVDCITAKGIITLEDVVEELIGVSFFHLQRGIILIHFYRRKFWMKRMFLRM